MQLQPSDSPAIVCPPSILEAVGTVKFCRPVKLPANDAVCVVSAAYRIQNRQLCRASGGTGKRGNLEDWPVRSPISTDIFASHRNIVLLTDEFTYNDHPKHWKVTSGNHHQFGCCHALTRFRVERPSQFLSHSSLRQSLSVLSSPLCRKDPALTFESGIFSCSCRWHYNF